MPLSDDEQRLLYQLERALHASDPDLAATLTTGEPTRTTRSRRGTGVLIASTGLILMLTAMARTIPALGVLAFTVILTGTYRAFRPTPIAPHPASPAPAAHPSYLDRAAQRFQHRRDTLDQ